MHQCCRSELLDPGDCPGEAGCQKGLWFWLDNFGQILQNFATFQACIAAIIPW